MIKSIAPNDPNGVGHLACDDATDIENLPAFARSNNLEMGTDCIVIDTGKALMMNSSYQFKEI